MKAHLGRDRRARPNVTVDLSDVGSFTQDKSTYQAGIESLLVGIGVAAVIFLLNIR